MYRKLFKNKETGEVVESYHHEDYDKFESYYPPLVCPMCDSDEMDCKEINNRTYIYTCPACPFIGMEYYDKWDMENLKEYLERENNK